ncbi:hypothetical protein [Candidimonas nitroreducens]|uniref:Helicase/UvrB N-terminal domain-containing protein n=1 Tax=Candidimonas nitroreducens TaxID=683354 RepID=A0A225MND1_9BURK|nr:hypothetical protein [Candidimonas nitroreducens]OWT61873.1 hypothetical protein CEY11_08555 [Candidimonas nitroreducens]
MAVIQLENTVLPDQYKALHYMLGSMARQAVGLDTRRYAYSLPCGGGKTQGAIALIVAAWELDLGLTFAVAASHVEALCDFKRQLMGRGIPEQAIGLWHSLRVNAAKAQAGSGYASLPATPDDDARPILLLSHEKLRRGNIPEYRGQPRSLTIWDESLIATRAHAIPVADIQAAAALAPQYAPALVPYLAKVAAVATVELDALRADPERHPQVFADVLSPGELDALRAALEGVHGSNSYIRAIRDTTEGLLSLLDSRVSVVETGSGKAGDGVLRCDVLVSPALQNIAILDASHAIRLLTRADPSIVDRTSPEMRAYRRYDNVTLRLINMPTGNRRMAASPAASLPAAREIARAIAAAPADDCVLIFTFKRSLSHLQRNLEKIGVDLSRQITVDGKQRPRIQFLTWGQETSRNDMRHCRLVIMAGVLRRDALDLAASLTAQQQAAQPRRNARTEVAEVIIAEQAHCVLQGIHRAACRMSDADGQAGRTDTLILSADTGGFRAVLEEAMPGARWVTSEPMDKQAGESKTDTAAHAILGYLAGLAENITKVSTRTLKQAIGAAGELGTDSFSTAIDRAVQRGVLKGIRWHREGRSLARNTG